MPSQVVSARRGRAPASTPALRAVAVCLLLCGCAGGAAQSDPEQLAQPWIDVQAAAPLNDLDDGGTVWLGQGWGKPEGHGLDPDWSSMIWAVGQEAEVHVVLPPGRPMDLLLRCLPFPWHDGAPEQTIELFHGDRALGRATLPRSWADARLPLPVELSTGRVVSLRLRFAHATRPGSGDRRYLAAAFSSLGAVPREVVDSSGFRDGHRYDAISQRLQLPAGGVARVALPPRRQVTVSLAVERAQCADCTLLLTVSDGTAAPARELWRASTSLTPVEATFATAADGIHTLWLELRPAAGGPAGAGAVELTVDRLSLSAPRDDDRGARPPDVFVYLIDTLRADAVADARLTPHLAAFASGATTYVNARSTSSWTLPAVVSMLTGMYPDRHGVRTGGYQIATASHLLPAWLGKRGYRSVGVSQSPIIGPLYGMEIGFDDFFAGDQLNGDRLRTAEARGLLGAWLADHGGRQSIFAYFHSVEPHAPYTPPAELVSLRPLPPLAEYSNPDRLVGRPDLAQVAQLARGLYDGEVRYADAQFGEFVALLRSLGLYDNSLVVVLSDHGEEFAEHGGMDHGTTLFDEVVRVPLLVKRPGGEGAGTRVLEPVSLVDVAPTVLALAGAGAGFELDGVPLPAWDAESEERALYFELAPADDDEANAAPIALVGLLAGDRKCIGNDSGVDRHGRPAPRILAYDLARDAREEHDLAAASWRATRECHAALGRWRRSRERLGARPDLRVVSEATLERLRSLGYAQ
jgi:arylsulfatase A-like enzyme